MSTQTPFSSFRLVSSQRAYFRYGNPTVLASNTVNFGTKFAEVNILSPYGYNTTTGRFLIPYSGVWMFTFSMYSGGNYRFNTSSASKSSLYGTAGNFDNVHLNTTSSAMEANATFGKTTHTQSAYCTTYLAQGDTIWVEKTAGGDATAAHSCFCGIYLG